MKLTLGLSPSRAAAGRLAALPLLLVSLCACAKQGGNWVRDEQLLVSWRAQPDSLERQSVSSLLRKLLVERPGRDSMLDGEISRFGVRGSHHRYLLIRSEADGDAQRKINLYVLTPDDPVEPVSRPFYTAVTDHPGWFEVLEITDLHADSLPELVFCEWRSGQERARPRAVGYTDSWFEIALDDSVANRCPVP